MPRVVPGEDVRVLQEQITLMHDTPYSLMSSRELVELAICRDSSTLMEVELAQRLDLALDLLEESDDLDDS
jgi:hypothetical protein